MVEAIITWSITGILVLFGLASACFPKTDSPKPTELPKDNPPINQPVPGDTTTDTSTDTSDKTPTKTDSPKPKELPKDNPPITKPAPDTSDKTPTKPYTPPPIVVPEGEKFLMGLLPVLYSGDKAAIRKNLYIEGLEDNFIDMIIDNMNYSKTAEEHDGYASAKVNKCESDTLDGKEMYRFDTTVTFKDGATCKEIFKIVKDSSGFKLTD